MGRDSRWTKSGALATALSAALAAALAGCRTDDIKPMVAPDPVTAPECVVLVHGRGRTKQSMAPIGRLLEKAGFHVANYGYRSVSAPIAEHAGELARRLPELVPAEAPRVHFVTHSLGGIVVRQLAKDHPVDRMGRVVMLAPPNQGSEVAEAIRDVEIVRALLGRHLAELGTREGDPPRTLGPVSFECGVITGDFSLWGKLFFDGANDGLVSVEGAKVAGMVDFLVVHHGHSFLMNCDDVQQQVLAFLRTGRFARGA